MDEQEEIQDPGIGGNESLLVFPVQEGDPVRLFIIGNIPEGRTAVMEPCLMEPGQSFPGLLESPDPAVRPRSFLGHPLEGLTHGFHDKIAVLEQDDFRCQGEILVHRHDFIDFTPEGRFHALFGKSIPVVGHFPFDEQSLIPIQEGQDPFLRLEGNGLIHRLLQIQIDQMPCTSSLNGPSGC